MKVIGSFNTKFQIALKRPHLLSDVMIFKVSLFLGFIGWSVFSVMHQALLELPT